MTKILIVGSGTDSIYNLSEYNYIICVNSSIGLIPADYDFKIIHLCVESIFLSDVDLHSLPLGPHITKLSAMKHRLERSSFLKKRSPLLTFIIGEVSSEQVSAKKYKPFILSTLNRTTLLRIAIKHFGFRVFLIAAWQHSPSFTCQPFKFIDVISRLLLVLIGINDLYLPDYIKPSTGVLGIAIALELFVDTKIDLRGIGTKGYFFAPDILLDRSKKIGHIIDSIILENLKFNA